MERRGLERYPAIRAEKSESDKRFTERPDILASPNTRESGEASVHTVGQPGSLIVGARMPPAMVTSRDATPNWYGPSKC